VLGKSAASTEWRTGQFSWEILPGASHHSASQSAAADLLLLDTDEFNGHRRNPWPGAAKKKAGAKEEKR